MSTNRIIDIRHVGEICRYMWWRLAQSLPDNDPKVLCRAIVHDLTQHWDGTGELRDGIMLLACQYNKSPPAPLTLEELVSLHVYGDLDHSTKLTTQSLDTAAFVQGKSIDFVEVVRWSTVYMFGASPSVEAMSKVEDWRAWLHEVFISGKCPTGLMLLDCCVVQGAAAALGKPSEEMLGIVDRFSACSLGYEDDEGDDAEHIYH